MTLASIQRDFCAYIAGTSPDIELAVRPGARRGLAVYHHAFRANLAACLRDTFEKTVAWLGDDAFEAAALEHIAEFPPRSWTLADYGAGFDRTLAGLYPGDPEVAEVAWLDWSLRRAFDGPDTVGPDASALAEIDWERAVLRVAPTLRLRAVTTNCAVLWRAMDDAVTPPAVAVLDGFSGLAVWRQELSPRFRSLAETEYRAIEAAAAGTPFGEICASLTADMSDAEEAAAFAGAMLGRWMSETLILGADNAG